MVFSPVVILCHSNTMIRRLLHNAMIKVTPEARIIDIEDWYIAIQMLRHGTVTALVAETPPAGQLSQTAYEVDLPRYPRLPIVILDAGASAVSMLAVAAFATSVKSMDELREAVMQLGRDDVDDVGIAIVVSSVCTSTNMPTLNYA